MTPDFPAPKTTAASRPWIVAAILFVVAFDIAFAWQQRAAAPASELGGHPDEGAHYVTGLAVQNSLAHPRQNPFSDSAAHYPIVRQAAWPQLFPAMQAAWMSVFGKSRRSVLLLMCVLAASVALLLFLALREEFGWTAAAIGAAIFLSLPLVREHCAMLMPDVLCAAWMLAATLAFARFVERGRLSDALGFGALATLAILTDRAGIALALLVPPALLFSGKWRVVGQPPFWAGIAPAIALGAALLWHFRDPALPGPSFDFMRAALPFYLAGLATALGVVLLLITVPGIVVKTLRPRERSVRLSCVAALIAATVLFAILAPADLDLRRLLPAIPAVIFFAVVGSAAVAQRLGRSPSFVLLTAGVLAIALHELAPATWRTKKWSGFRALVEILMEDPSRPNARVLVCSDRTGEGMFISELAMAENAPARFIELADSLLANTTFGEDEDLARLLISRHIDYIVFDSSNPELDRDPHHDMLRRVLRDKSDRFWEMFTSPVIRDNIAQDAPARLYRVTRSDD